ncbi:hypothetical protein [Nocardioides sp.]|uniref:hypothetical protein n=1 Tax=Nocardioides sp. TaxID=35761 RepID=UPI00286BD854|nr:hypothetical protein [Nocardioides sp.]
MLMIDWPLAIMVGIGLAVLVGVVGGYVSARLAVIGSERRLNRSLKRGPADV